MNSYSYFSSRMAIIFGLTVMVNVNATPNIADAFYRDSFTLTSSKVEGGELAGSVERLRSGLQADWSGFWPVRFKYTTAQGSTNNDGSSKGVISLVGGDETAFSALLPLLPAMMAEPKLAVGVDIFPALAVSSLSIAMQWGLVFTVNPKDNYFATPGNIRIGIAREKNGGVYFIRAEQRSGNTSVFSVPPSFKGWTNLRVEFSTKSRVFEIYVNNTYVGDFTPTKDHNLGFVGIEAVQKNDASVVSYFDNFYVAPLKR